MSGTNGIKLAVSRVCTFWVLGRSDGDAEQALEEGAEFSWEPCASGTVRIFFRRVPLALPVLADRPFVFDGRIRTMLVVEQPCHQPNSCCTGKASGTQLMLSCLDEQRWQGIVSGMTRLKPHRKTVKHYHQPGDLHELTFSCYHRLPLLTNDDWRKRLSRSLDSAGEEQSLQLVAFVLMPEHVHLLVDPLLTKPRIDLDLARLKQPFSKEIKSLLLESGAPLLSKLTVRERPHKTCFRFWQAGPGYDRNLNQPPAILAAINYLHENPVRRGLCRQAIDWKWSSARWYLSDPPRQQDPDLPHIHGLRPGSLDEGTS